MLSPGTFTNGELTFEAGSTVCLFHCKVWDCSENRPYPVPHFVTGLFTLEDYQSVEPSAYAWEAGWYVFPIGGFPTVVDNIDEPMVIPDEEGLCLFVSMDDLWPQLNPDGYASMLVQERDMEMWAEMEERDRKRAKQEEYYDCNISDVTGKEMK